MRGLLLFAFFMGSLLGLVCDESFVNNCGLTHACIVFSLVSAVFIQMSKSPKEAGYVCKFCTRIYAVSSEVIVIEFE
jgi:hypothetical protein